ncbi:hypothetical protein BDV93DRAFT_525736 [Ceratobasidium sp. AG-I]|nr:hypothetical protein BDV93DRAFT_525736 [Ceratobasidium sp. AG-I]
MPKRPKTPPPADDEPKYISVYNPYPTASLEEEDDRKRCARWLSCFIGKDNLYCLFHKPSSPNVIIAEINHELDNKKMRQILGEHPWIDAFPKSKDEDGTSSKIFYSVFKTRREVEKTGWKPVHIDEDEVFKGFNPTRGTVVAFPYPETDFCLPPQLPGNVAALELFRYLPVEVFPEAARLNPPAPTPSTVVTPRVVPGSAPPVVNQSAGTGGGKKGKKKGKANSLDPTVRPTAPLARTAESSAKAKIIHKQPAPTMASMYDDSDDDDGAAYMPGHPGPGTTNWQADFNDMSIKDDEPPEKIEEFAEPEYEVVPLKANAKPKDEGPVCPEHNKRCKSGICEWAREQKRKQKRIESRNGPQTGQYQRVW